MRYLFSEWDKIALRIKSASRILLLLDFDGTLVPIQKDPAQCYLSDTTKEQLKQLADSKRCYLTILSGRALADVKKRVGIRNIYYGGNHGLDIVGPEIRYTHPKALLAKPIISDIKDMLKKEIKNIKGAWVEDKKFTVSLHFRSVEREDISVVKKVFYRTVAEFLNEKFMSQRDTKGNKNVIPAKTGIQTPSLRKQAAKGIRFLFSQETLDSRLHGNDRLEVLPGEKLLFMIKGKKVLELIPNASWDKGKAALWILQKLKNNCLPIYIGDDYTDETAFKSLHKKGITIRIGKSKKTSAKYFLKGQWEVSRLLRQFQNAIK